MYLKNDDDIVSIIMPAYNSENYIAESIKSVLAQTYIFWELIIINDFSNDNTLLIIEKYKSNDKRIRLINNERNLGVAMSRNKGIQVANGRYIAFLDSDDIWLREKLKKQVAFMKSRNIGISFSQYRHFTSNINETGKIIDVKEKLSYGELLKGNIIGCLTVMIDRNVVNKINMPKQRHEDYITWLNILKTGLHAYGIKEDLARYRKNIKSLTGNKFKSLAWTWNVYRNSQKISLIKSMYYISFYVVKGLKKHF